MRKIPDRGEGHNRVAYGARLASWNSAPRGLRKSRSYGRILSGISKPLED